jgi:hypothetical protein
VGSSADSVGPSFLPDQALVRAAVHNNLNSHMSLTSRRSLRPLFLDLQTVSRGFVDSVVPESRQPPPIVPNAAKPSRNCPPWLPSPRWSSPAKLPYRVMRLLLTSQNRQRPLPEPSHQRRGKQAGSNRRPHPQGPHRRLGLSCPRDGRFRSQGLSRMRFLPQELRFHELYLKGRLAHPIR